MLLQTELVVSHSRTEYGAAALLFALLEVFQNPVQYQRTQMRASQSVLDITPSTVPAVLVWDVSSSRAFAKA